MSETASISSGVATRYATAVFDLAREAKKLPELGSDIDALASALDVSPDFNNLISSPVYTRQQQGSAVAAIAAKMALGKTITSTLGLMAEKRRLFVLPFLIEAIRGLIAEEKGEVSAQVVSAKKLTKTQETKLAASLKKAIGKDVIINSSVDTALIGGLIVKVGSRMIDSSIASKLSNLQNAMKEVG
ncbi:MAG: F0F1 ATP synthase subunit delta [Alphaproteobacteria bacterium]|nr:F0F1 ATP synthase subunit delta [Alphaproteobacteria bacterium]